MTMPVPRHPIAECDRALRSDPRYSPNHCDWLPEFDCPCGRVWTHVCDEAEGCFYVVTGEGPASAGPSHTFETQATNQKVGEA